MTKQRKRLYLGFGIYFIVIILYIASSITQPIFDRLTPNVLGLPFSQFNVVLIQLMICGGLCVLFPIDRKLHQKEKAMRERGEKVDY